MKRVARREGGRLAHANCLRRQLSENIRRAAEKFSGRGRIPTGPARSAMLHYSLTPGIYLFFLFRFRDWLSIRIHTYVCVYNTPRSVRVRIHNQTDNSFTRALSEYTYKCS